MALSKNHLAVVSEWATGPASAGRTPVAVAALLSGILLAPFLLIDAADEVHDVSYVVGGEAVIDPARHGRPLDAVEHGVEDAAVIDAGEEGRIAEVARFGRNVERVGPLAVGLAAVTAGAAFQEDLFAVLDGCGAGSHRVLGGNVVRLDFAERFLGEGGQDVTQDAVDLFGLEAVLPGGHGGSGDAFLNGRDEAFARLGGHERGLG